MTNTMKPIPSENTPSPGRKAMARTIGATALLSVLALSSGCVVAVRPAPVATVYSTGPVYPDAPQEVVVDTAPPLYEYVGVAPGPGFLWIGGYYHWSGARWVWYRGHYEHPPHPGARWYGPRYEVRGGARVYVRGYWR